MDEFVILVDEADRRHGLMEKMEAHRKGLLHRAFSVFIHNSKGLILLQQRSLGKYHSGGLWTNACCSHPRDGESTIDAAHRRLMEEMGFDTDLQEVLAFTYRAELDNNLIEHEYDHVFNGRFDGDIHPNPEEVADYKWMRIADIQSEIQSNPEKYTAWFRIIFSRYVEFISTQNE